MPAFGLFILMQIMYSSYRADRLSYSLEGRVGVKLRLTHGGTTKNTRKTQNPPLHSVQLRHAREMGEAGVQENWVRHAH